MSAPTPAELFISTLAAMLEAERDLQRARQLRRNRAAARRYIATVPTSCANRPERPDPDHRDAGMFPWIAG